MLDHYTTAPGYCAWDALFHPVRVRSYQTGFFLSSLFLVVVQDLSKEEM